MIRTVENFSISMVYGLFYFGRGRLSSMGLSKFVKFDALAQDYLNGTMQFAPVIYSRWHQFTTVSWRTGYQALLTK